ncbi:right-handed parallel beta-helix repeat-containing protein [bacterium]|nr:right-handed parallel beta-helix repeat-containing protein [bacterium]
MPIDIWNQPDFEAEIAEGFTEQLGDPDYIIHTNVPNDYTIDADEILTIDEGVVIQLDDGVEIIVVGRITTGLNGANPIVFQRLAEGQGGQGDNWEAITIVGDDDGGLNDNQGIVTLNHVEFRGGGAGADPDPGDADWRGMIRLTGNTPVLVLGTDQGPEESNLSDSETSGIVVHGEIVDFVLTLYNVDMDDEDDPITDIGIKINDPRPDPENGDEAWNIVAGDMLIDADCDIQWCGAHGLASYFFEGVDYDILNSVFSDNGTDNPNPDEDRGAGLYFLQQGIYGLEYTIDIENTFAERNSWDGMRFVDMTSFVHITSCKIVNNQRRGIYYDFSGEAQLGFVEQCTITDNDWEGIIVRKGEGEEAGIKIRGNVFSNNGDTATPVDWEQDHVLNTPPRLANIRLYGFLGGAVIYDDGDDGANGNRYTEILNNVIEGANSGICIQFNGQEVCPRHVDISNNIQYGAEYQGLRIDEYAFRNNEEHTFVVYNNVFHNNGNVQAEASGIWIGPDCPDRADGDWLQNNILSGNEDFGIHNPDAHENEPIFPNNGFQNNDDNVENCTSNPTVELDVNDPLYVDADNEDFHLFWNSGMINEGGSAEIFVGQGPGEFDAKIDGEFNDEFVEKDGSAIDIGAYGGEGAILFDFSPYNVIGDDEDEMNGTLVRDYYRAISNFNIPVESTLNIEAMVYIEMFEDVTFKIHGEIHVNGDEDEEVIFKGYTYMDGEEQVTEIWDQIQFTSTASEDSDISWTNIEDAWCGIYFSSVVGDGVTRIPVIDCRILNCECRGITIYNSPVEISGFHPESAENPDPNMIGNIVDEFPSTDNVGIKISSCSALDVWVENTYIHHCGDNLYAPYETGMMILSSSLVDMTNVTCENNGVTGLYIADGDPIIEPWDEFGVPPNVDIRNNGQEFDPQGPEDDEWQGAEIYLTLSSYPDFADWDIYEEEENDHGYSIYKDPVWNPNQLDAQGCYWNQDDLENPPPNNPLGEDWFFDGGLENINVANWLGEAVDDDPEIADFDNTFSEAVGLFREGETESALRILQWIISHRPESVDAIKSLRLLPDCYQRLDMDFGELRRFYTSLGARNRSSELARIARIMVPRSLVTQGRLEDAMEMYDSVAEDAENEAEEIIARYHFLELNEVLDLNHINSVADRRALAAEQAGLLMRLTDMENGQNRNMMPQEFKLSGVYPNPFNSFARVRYLIDCRDHVKLAVYDLSGREVAVLFEGVRTPGEYSVSWEARDLPSGIYMFKMIGENRMSTMKVALVK